MLRQVAIASVLWLVVGPAAADDVVARVEYVLQTPRTREPVLGGAKDKVAVTVWIPSGAKTVRGGVCNPFSKGDLPSAHWQAACRRWGFAYVQVDFDAVRKEEFGLLTTGLADLAKKTGRPELERLPLCFLGMSRGGGMSMQLAERMPERTLASVPVCLEVGPGSDATRRIPVLTVFGERDGQQMAKLLAKLPLERKQGAQFGIAVQWAKGHEFSRANNVAFVFLDDVISARLPKDAPAPGQPIPLATLPLEAGWLGDVGTWGKDGRAPTISPWKSFVGDRDQACWFPTERTAAVWRAFVAGTNDVILEAPAGLGDKQKFPALSAKSPIAVVVRAKGDATKVTLWNGAERLAEKTSAPWEFETRLPAGIHGLHATAEIAGQVRWSRPNAIVVAE